MKNLASALLACSAFFMCFHAFAGATKTSYDAFPAVKKGGTLNDGARITPISLNPMLIMDADSREFTDGIYMGLYGTDGETYEPYPVLAEKLDISKDKKDYTFTLNKNAKWSDGTPVTSDDVEFTIQKILDPKVEAASLRVYYEGVRFTKIDNSKFTFHVDQPKFNTLEFLQGFAPIQKKQFVNEADFNKSRENLRPIGDGPFKLKTLSRDQYVSFERDTNWWAKDLPQFKARYNQDQWVYKIIPDPALRYEKFIRGEQDIITFTPDQYVTQVTGKDKEKYGASATDGKSIWAGKFVGDLPHNWSGMALNNENPLFANVNTRKGLAYLFDYKTIIERAYSGLVDQATTPFGGRTDNADPALRAGKGLYSYDPKKAADFFAKDGWKQEPGQPFLMKTINGQKVPFHFTVKYYSESQPASKTVVILKEIFKKNGVDLELRPMDGTALYKDFDDRQFEATMMGWGGGSIHPDPKQIWHSSSIGQGSNKVSYKNPKVDALIEKANLEFNTKKRAKILQEISKILYDEVPYIFVMENRTSLQGLNSKFKSPKWVERYGNGVSKDLMHE